MSVAHDLLDRLAEIGASIRPAGDRLIVRAGNRPVPGELVKLLRRAKPDVLALLARDEPDAITGPQWRARLTALTFEWSARQHQWEEAKQLAWGDLQNEWHTIHGQRWPNWQCAGCRKPIGGIESIHLPDGNRVHAEPIDCLIGFGRRWRGDADTALSGFGLHPPSFSERHTSSKSETERK